MHATYQPVTIAHEADTKLRLLTETSADRTTVKPEWAMYDRLR